MFKRALAQRVLLLFAILTIAAPVAAQIKILQPAFTITARTVTGGSVSMGVVSLPAAAPAGGITLQLASTNTALAIPDSSVTVPEGATATRFGIKTVPVATDTTVTIKVTSPAAYLFPVTILAPKVASLAFNNPTVVGGTPTTATVVLTGPVPAGFVLPLATSDANAAPLPVSVLAFEMGGATSQTFTLTTKPVNAPKYASITAGGSEGKTAQIAINPVAPAIVSLTAAPTEILSGTRTQITVVLDRPAPAGFFVPLSGPSDLFFTLPPAFAVAEGATTTTLSPQALWVTSPTVATITAGAAPNQKNVDITILPVSLKSFRIDKPTIAGGTSDRATLITELDGQAGTVAHLLNVTSSHPELVDIPLQGITGSSTNLMYKFAARMATVDTPVTLTVKDGGITKTADITVLAPRLGSFTANGSLGGWDPLTGKNVFTQGTDISVVGGAEKIVVHANTEIPLEIERPVVALSSSDPMIKPGTLTVYGSTGGYAEVDTYPVNTGIPLTLTGTLGGVAKSVNVMLKPIAVDGVLAQAVGGAVGSTIASIRGGQKFALMSYLNAPAPATGFTVPLTSSHPAIVPVPATTAVAPGSQYAIQEVQAAEIPKDLTVTITAGQGATAHSASITIVALHIGTFSLSSQRVLGGATIIGVVQLTGPAGSSGFTVPLASTIAQVKVPVSVTVPAGMSSVSFPITTTAVSADTSGIVTAGKEDPAKNLAILLTP